LKHTGAAVTCLEIYLTVLWLPV